MYSLTYFVLWFFFSELMEQNILNKFEQKS